MVTTTCAGSLNRYRSIIRYPKFCDEALAVPGWPCSELASLLECVVERQTTHAPKRFRTVISRFDATCVMRENIVPSWGIVLHNAVKRSKIVGSHSMLSGHAFVAKLTSRHLGEF